MSQSPIRSAAFSAGQHSGATSNGQPGPQPPPTHPAELQLDHREQGARVTLAVRGEVDLGSAPALDREIRAAEVKARRIVLDLADLEFIDSTGIHVLIDAQHRAATNGHELALTHVPARTERLLRLTGLITRITIE